MHVAQNWRLNAQRYSMTGVRCESCAQAIFPPREVCPYCSQKGQEGNAKELKEIAREGTGLLGPARR
jgi:uncharacterized OB-fold protein